MTAVRWHVWEMRSRLRQCIHFARKGWFFHGAALPFFILTSENFIIPDNPAKANLDKLLD